MGAHPSGNIIRDPRPGRENVGLRIRYRGQRPYITLGPSAEWPDSRVHAHVDAILRDLAAGRRVPELDRQIARKNRLERARHEPVLPSKDPAGQVYSRLRIAAQILQRFHDGADSDHERLLVREALTDIHAAQDTVVRMIGTEYGDSRDGNGHER